MGLTNPEICPNICLEGCHCDEGFVADGNLCVPVQNCGCSINGTYLKVRREKHPALQSLQNHSERFLCSPNEIQLTGRSACSVVVKLLDLDPQGRWFDPWGGHDKICTAVGPLGKALNPRLLQGVCLLLSLINCKLLWIKASAKLHVM